MELVVGDGSTWSMRSWICLALARVPFKETVIPLHSKGYKDILKKYSDTGLVPVLIHEDIVVHDSLAIAEYINELGTEKIYPDDQAERALARSLCSELHSGFPAIRTNYSMPWEPGSTKAIDLNTQLELDRLNMIWAKASGPHYFSKPSIIDAFYSVMAYRLKSYGIELSGRSGEYQSNLLEWPLFRQMLQAAEDWKR